MKVALLTIWRERNYGAELQAYATIKAIKELGHDVEIIDIRLSDVNPPSLNGRIGKFVSSFGPGIKKFEFFWNSYFPTTKRYKSIQDIQNDPPKADIYLVGSDQVWNPDLTKEYALLYFLNFGGQDVKRVSYASSFGTSKWSHPEIKKEVTALLSKFQYISCREIQGQLILKDTFNLRGETHIDPTLLFHAYPELTGPINQENTLVYYPLFKFKKLADYSNELAKKLNLRAINANWQTHIMGKYLWDRNGVEGWVKTIAQATFVITPSFHGLVFSLIYHRQFAVLLINKTLSSRIVNLLSLLGLQDRLYYSLEELDEAKPWESIIDYDSIELKLQELRKVSFEYLERVIS